MIAANGPSIASLGDVALDIFIRPNGAPLQGSDVMGQVRLVPGGSAANVAVWVARLGLASHFVGAVGDDFAAGFLRGDLESEGVKAHLFRLPTATAAIAVLVEESGERTMINDRAAAAMLTSAQLTSDLLPPGCWLHLPAYSLFAEPLASTALEAARICRETGGGLGVDASSVGPLRAYGRERFLHLLDDLAPDIFFVNAEEGAFLSDMDDPERGIEILRRHAPIVLWKLGRDGALAAGERRVRAPGLPVLALDSTGAGDAFAAAFTVAHVRGNTLEEALNLATHLATAVVQHIGARPRLDLSLLYER